MCIRDSAATCEPCLESEFSLDGRVCLACPTLDANGDVIPDEHSRGATCRGGIVYLKDSFWYDTSAPLTDKTVLQRCASALACAANNTGATRTIRCGPHRNASVVLCGECDAGYVKYADGRCVPCASKLTVWSSAVLGLAMLSFVVSLSLIHI